MRLNPALLFLTTTGCLQLLHFKHLMQQLLPTFPSVFHTSWPAAVQRTAAACQQQLHWLSITAASSQ
jgi:hypothetical protein